MAGNKKVLLFAPFGSWLVHHQVDAVLGAALSLRGCNVVAVGCDGIFENCLIGGRPPAASVCRDCLKKGSGLFSGLRIPLVALSRFMQKADARECRAWAGALKSDELPRASFEGCDIGEWAKASLLSYFTASTLDYGAPEVEPIARSFAFNGALLQRLYGRILQWFSPDYVICYNGGHHYYRVAFELSRRRGLPVLVHERAQRMGDTGFQLRLNEQGNGYVSDIANWEHWRDIPLRREECVEAREYLASNERGKNASGQVVNPFCLGLSEAAPVRRTLRLPPEAPLVALFASTDWEYGMDRAHCDAVFKSQLDGIRRIIDLLAGSDIHLVIRHHPSRRGVKYSDLSYLTELFRLNRSLPSNVRVVMPHEKFSSYALMWSADAALTFGSTTGIEATARGCSAISMIDNYPSTVSSVDSIGALVDEKGFDAFFPARLAAAMEKSRRFGLDDLRAIYRSVHYLYFRNSYRFKTFGIKDFHSMDIRATSSEDLLEGRDPVLDQVCRHIIHGEPLHLALAAGRTPGSLEEESAFLQAELESLLEKRRRAREREAAVLPGGGPTVTAIHLPSRDGEPRLSESLVRSRHKAAEHDRDAFGNDEEFLDALVACLSRAAGEYTYLAGEDVHVDESLLSTAIDLLSGGNGTGRDAVLVGAWLCDESGAVLDEILTGEALPKSVGEIGANHGREIGLAQLLSLVVWRRQALLRLVLPLLRSRCPVEAVSERVYEALLHALSPGREGLQILRLPQPLVAIHAARRSAGSSVLNQEGK